MSTRLLYLFCLVACVCAAYLYYYQDAVNEHVTSAKHRYDYRASNIVALQTNAEGHPEFRMDADTLAHDFRTDELEVKQLKARMLRVGKNQTTFSFVANQATWHQPSSLLKLLGGVTVIHEGVETASNARPFANMVFTTQALDTNLKTKTINVIHPVKMTINNSSIFAESMRADLNRGEYEFDKLHAEYQQ